jgi:hypothetical protein
MPVATHRHSTSQLKMAKKNLFWKDLWLHDKPLYKLAPILLKLCAQKYISMYEVATNSSQLTFTRWLPSEVSCEWDNILNDVIKLELNAEENIIRWRLGKMGVFPLILCMMQ